jgi:2,5-diamino-6-(ribosylamino)-4(3H)-pyrimidinone 5'-phosphate reductase
MVSLCSETTPEDHLAYLQAERVDPIVVGGGRVDLRRALEQLAERFGVRTVRVDSGGTLNGALLRAGLVDEVSLLVHPYLVGGTSPRSPYLAEDLRPGADAVPARLSSVEQVADGLVWLRYEVSAG